MNKKTLLITIVQVAFLLLFLFALLQKKPLLWLAFFVLSVIAAIFFGRFYCGWICPMNTSMMITGFFIRLLKLKQRNAPKWLRGGWLAWVLLVVSILSMILLKKLFHMDVPILLYLLILSVLVTLFFKPEVFHNLLCPFGVLLGLTGRFAVFSRRVNSKRCNGCKSCESVCHSIAILVSTQYKKAEINRQLCHQCYNCEIQCPQNAIDYGK